VSGPVSGDPAPGNPMRGTPTSGNPTSGGPVSGAAAPRILVVDDEPQVHRFLKPALEVAGYAVSQATTAMAGLRLAADQAPAAVLLDLGLPDLDGQEVILRLRAFSAVPIVVVSARDGIAEKIRALDHGADDYIDKPFAPGELLARLRACLRRARAQQAAVERWRHGTVEVDLAHRRVLVGGVAVAFTPREYDLLSVLVRNAGLVLTHRQLLTAVWGTGHAEDVQYLRVYVGLVRQKLGPEGAAIVLTAPGIGYRLAEGEA